MVTALVITAILLVLAVFGTVQAFRRLKNVARVLLGITGVLFSLLLVFVLLGEAMFYRFMPRDIAFNPATHKGPAGMIVLPSDLASGSNSLTLMRTGRDSRMEMVHLTSTDGVFVAPVGKYSTAILRREVTRDGATWTMRSTLPLGLTVQSDKDTRPGIGPPYVASVGLPELRGDKLLFGMSIIGRGRESCSIQRIGGMEPPRFRILSKTGKVLQEGKFAYG